MYEQWLEATLVRRRNEEMGQYTLFGGGSQEVEEVVLALPEGEWDQKVKLAFEREMLGLYISDHPLLGVARRSAGHRSSGVPELWEQPDGASVTIGGMVGAINRRFTRNGEAMLFFQCEDLEGSVEVVAFPKVAADALGVIREGAIVVVSGRLDHRGDDIKVVAREIKELEVRGADEVRLEVSAAALSPRAVGRLKEILGNHPGTSPVFLHMVGNGNHKVLKLGDEHRVEPRSALYAELRELFGSGAIRLKTADGRRQTAVGGWRTADGGRRGRRKSLHPSVPRRGSGALLSVPGRWGRAHRGAAGRGAA